MTLGKIGRKKYRVVVASVTAVVVLASAGLSFWIYRTYQKTQQEERDYQQKISEARVKQEKVPVLEKEVIKLRENVKEYVKILPDTNEVNGFVKKLSDFDEQSGVELYVLKDDKRNNNRRKTKEIFGRETFRVALRGNIYQFLKFISLVENYERFIKISEIQVKSGTQEKDMLPGDVVHEISLLIETFVYHGNEGVAGATKIQNYDKKREMLMDEIASARNQIEVEHYEYVFDPMVRDPFLDPRPFVCDAEQPEGLDVEEQEKFITEMMDKVLEIKQLLEYARGTGNIPPIRVLEIRSEVATRILALNKQINSAIEEHWFTQQVYATKLEKEIVPEVTRLNKVYKDLVPVAMSRNELESIKSDLESKFDAGHYDKCLESYKNIMEGSLKEQLAAMMKDPEKRQVLESIQLLGKKAEAALEFEKIELKITGIIYQDRGSVAIVNGKVLKEGQFLQDDLMVEKIEARGILFRYKGLTFSVRQ